ncbi:MAG: MFS transporter [Gammaproteobacteria bacterium]|nr:MFS transporter [Gammaproteobacteria bacterium]
MLCLSIFTVYLAVSGITPNLIPALTDRGLTPASAARIQGLLGIAIILGRVVVGALVDRFWAPGVALVSLLLPVAGCLILATTTSLPLIYTSVLLIGFAAGAELDLMAFLVSRYFGLRHYSKIYSVMYALLAFGSGTAPMLFAAVYDRTASYEVSFIAAAALFAIGAVVVVALGRYPVRPTTAAQGASP